MVSELTASADGEVHGSTSERLRALPAHVGAKIKGQTHVLPRICSVLIRGELGLANFRRPKGSFLFVGPTGVGKTETANVFTDYLFPGHAAIRFDMSEYQNQIAIEKLIGNGVGDAGLLGRSLRNVARGTLLFDEIEKAHPLVLDLFLQVLEDARITLATGEALDLRNFYVVFTSNIGSEEAIRMENAPFASVERSVLARVRERLRPELLGRITEMVVFARLSYAVQREICSSMIASECRRLAALHHRIEVSDAAVEFLVGQGYHRTLGARPMRGVVERYLQEAVSDSVLGGSNGDGVVVVDEGGEKLLLQR